MRQSNYRTNSPTWKTLSFYECLDYELVDCGNQRKLERFGKLLLDRPEVEAKWQPKISRLEWEKADWYFYEEAGKKGNWINKTNAPDSWTINYNHQKINLKFNLSLTAFKHIGLFPEQAANWKFIQEFVTQKRQETKVLNLFAYTGAASIIAAKSGAMVTNVDSVKQVLNWGRENAAINSVDKIRWILEDARKFVEKSVRRRDLYEGIIMDPPAFGYGSKNEKWKLERDLKALLEQSIQLLNPKTHFFILNTYSPKMGSRQLEKILAETKGFPKKYESLQLGLQSTKSQFLALGNLVRFRK